MAVTDFEDGLILSAAQLDGNFEFIIKQLADGVLDGDISVPNGTRFTSGLGTSQISSPTNYQYDNNLSEWVFIDILDNCDDNSIDTTNVWVQGGETGTSYSENTERLSFSTNRSGSAGTRTGTLATKNGVEDNTLYHIMFDLGSSGNFAGANSASYNITLVGSSGGSVTLFTSNTESSSSDALTVRVDHASETVYYSEDGGDTENSASVSGLSGTYELEFENGVTTTDTRSLTAAFSIYWIGRSTANSTVTSGELSINSPTGFDSSNNKIFLYTDQTTMPDGYNISFNNGSNFTSATLNSWTAIPNQGSNIKLQYLVDIDVTEYPKTLNNTNLQLSYFTGD